jgi:citrate lyase subunit beta/citryl-CoA lyase
MNRTHPAQALFDPDDMPVASLPVCDHYAGVEARMTKSLALQQELGPVFDITLDCEDGAPVGGEAEQAHLVAEMALSPANAFGRVGARVHPLGHPAFEGDVRTLLARAGRRLAYLMVPKPRHLADVQQACSFIDTTLRECGLEPAALPLHFLVETHGAVREVDAIAAHPRVQSISFGLMDFVSAHRGAIPASAMGLEGQFSHPLVLRAKLAIAAACHAHGKTPSHCVVTEFSNAQAIETGARRAAMELGYTRMWSIHPSQIAPIVAAFAPSAVEVEMACEILMAAQAAQWAPINHRWQGRDTLHDRASFRYFWQVLQRAHQTGRAIPGHCQGFFEAEPAAATL